MLSLPAALSARLKLQIARGLVRLGQIRSAPLAPAEFRQPIPPGATAWNDSIYFMGANEDGTSLVARLGFRSGGVTETWLFVHIPGEGLYDLSIEDVRNGSSDGAAGLRMACTRPLAEWTVRFEGRLTGPGSEVDATLDLRFDRDGAAVDYDRDLDVDTLARGIADEHWTLDLFRRMRETHQHHHEQAGQLRGSLTLGGRVIPLDLRGLRDRSFGTRDWGFIRRHQWVGVALSDGSYLNVTQVHLPTLRRVLAGYRLYGERIVPLTAATPLDELFPPGADPPDKYTLSLGFANGAALVLDAERYAQRPYGLGNGASTLFEGLARYRERGGSLHGIGISEFGRANDVANRRGA